MRLASKSLWKTNWPLSGHLTQRFSGVSRRSNERIFGGTTLEIQFIDCLVCNRSTAAVTSLCDSSQAAGELSDKPTYRGDSRRGCGSAVPRSSNPLNKGRTNRHAVSHFGNRRCAFHVFHAKPNH